MNLAHRVFSAISTPTISVFGAIAFSFRTLWYFICGLPPGFYDFCAFARHTLIITGGFSILKVHFIPYRMLE
jgi:hypothetical protein